MPSGVNVNIFHTASWIKNPEGFGGERKQRRARDPRRLPDVRGRELDSPEGVSPAAEAAEDSRPGTSLHQDAA